MKRKPSAEHGHLIDALDRMKKEPLAALAATLDTRALWRELPKTIGAPVRLVRGRLPGGRLWQEHEREQQQEQARTDFDRAVLERMKMSTSDLRTEVALGIRRAAKVPDTDGWSRAVVLVAASELRIQDMESVATGDIEWLITMKMESTWQQELAETMARASDAERKRVVDRVSSSIAQLGDAERRALHAALGVDVSGPVVLRAVVTGGLGIGLAGGVQLAGFGAYLALTTVMHAVSTTLFGVTLPFAVYTSATTALSLASGGLVAIPVLASWVLFYRSASKRRVRQKLPLAVTLVLATDAERPLPSWA